MDAKKKWMLAVELAKFNWGSSLGRYCLVVITSNIQRVVHRHRKCLQFIYC